MSLLLKALRQIDQQSPEPTYDPFERAEPILETPLPEPQWSSELSGILEMARMAPPPAPRLVHEPISMEALFAIPLETRPTIPPPIPAMSAPAGDSPLDRLESLRALLANAGDVTIPAPAIKPPQAGKPPLRSELLQSNEASEDVSPKNVQSKARAVAPAPILREEYLELCNHLRARLPVQTHCALAVVDAGRVVNDAAWLVHLGAGMLSSLGKSAVEQPRVLLVEAAGSEAGIARHLAIEPRLGMSDVLEGGASWSQAIQHTVHPGIDLLVSGANLIEGLQGERFQRAWADLKQQYDLLIVAAGPIACADSPAVISVADVLLTASDAAVLSIELDATPRRVAERSRTSLVDRGVKLVGCVVHWVERV